MIDFVEDQEGGDSQDWILQHRQWYIENERTNCVGEESIKWNLFSESQEGAIQNAKDLLSMPLADVAVAYFGISTSVLWRMCLCGKGHDIMIPHYVYFASMYCLWCGPAKHAAALERTLIGLDHDRVENTLAGGEQCRAGLIFVYMCVNTLQEQCDSHREFCLRRRKGCPF